MKNAAFYEQKGRDYYAAGVVMFPAKRGYSWQRAAFWRGYIKARNEWRENNPGNDEWACMASKNMEFCKKAVSA